MKWTIQVPEDKAKGMDLWNIDVIPEAMLTQFLQTRKQDQNFKPIRIDAIAAGPVDYNVMLTDAALQHGANLAVYQPDGHIDLYRVSEQKKAGREYPGIGVGVIAFEPGDPYNIVMTLRGGTTNNLHGKWDLPGGTVEKGKSLDDTVVDEMLEEACVKVKPLGYIELCDHRPDNQHWFSLTAVAEITEGTVQNGEPHKFDAVQKINISQFPSNTSELTKRAVDLYRQNQSYITISSITE